MRRRRSRTRIASGEALERFRQNIELQGGDPTICDKPEKLVYKGLKKVEITADTDGYVCAIDTFAVGSAVVAISAADALRQRTASTTPLGYCVHS